MKRALSQYTSAWQPPRHALTRGRLFVSLLVAASLAGCLESQQPESTPGSPSPRDQACPPLAPDDPSLARLRIDVEVDPQHQDRANLLGPYEEGYSKVKWDREGNSYRQSLNHSLTRFGCVVFDVPLGVTIQTFVAVPHRDGWACSWIGGAGNTPIEEPVVHLTHRLLLACT